MFIDRYAITKSDYTLISGDYAVDFKIGEGVDMNDPDNPIGRQSPFESDTEAFETITDNLSSTVASTELSQSSITYLESTRVEEYSKSLAASIRASYGLSSLKASYRETIEKNESNFSYIIKIADSKTQDTGNTSLEFKTAPSTEGMTGTDDEKILQFLQEWGSHFIQKMSFGYEIAFEASVSKSLFTKSTDFQARLQAAFGGLSAGGSVDLTETNKLIQSGVQIQGRIVCGGITPDVPRTFNTVEDIARFFLRLSNGEIKIKRGPYKIYLQSYYSKLLKFPKSQRLLNPLIESKPKSDHGVPNGAIISFHPPSNITKENIDAIGEDYWIPEGWAICNGLNGTPNLIDRFIMGSGLENISKTGGSTSHKHRLESVGLDLEIDASHYGDGTIIHEAEHLPPFYRLIYLMKL